MSGSGLGLLRSRMSTVQRRDQPEHAGDTDPCGHNSSYRICVGITTRSPRVGWLGAIKYKAPSRASFFRLLNENNRFMVPSIYLMSCEVLRDRNGVHVVVYEGKQNVFNL
jgi:hypothetical protein